MMPEGRVLANCRAPLTVVAIDSLKVAVESSIDTERSRRLGPMRPTRTEKGSLFGPDDRAGAVHPQAMQLHVTSPAGRVYIDKAWAPT